jgi:hypothetical protein
MVNVSECQASGCEEVLSAFLAILQNMPEREVNRKTGAWRMTERRFLRLEMRQHREEPDNHRKSVYFHIEPVRKTHD